MPYSKDTKVGRVVDKIISEVPGLIAISVVELKSGMSLASYTNSPTYDIDAASAYLAEVVRQEQKALTAMRLTNEEIEDILITLSTQIHLIKILNNVDYFIQVAASTKDTNLGFVRSVLRRYVDELVV